MTDNDLRKLDFLLEQFDAQHARNQSATIRGIRVEILNVRRQLRDQRKDGP